MSRRSSKVNAWNLSSRPSPAGISVLLVGLLLCVLAGLWQYREQPQDVVSQSTAAPSVRINELMSSNKSALLDGNGAYSDWIELINTSREAVDITGWKISDGSSLFTFPSHVLGAGETVIVYASGKVHALPGETFYAPFKLSSSGETITLSDSAEATVDSVEFPAMDANASYARNASGAWESTFSITPGLANDAEYVAAQESILDTGLVISEVMPKNVSYAPDADGDCSDYIELYNGSGRAIALKGYMLSDDEGDRGKYIFPDVTIQPSEYLLVYASGKESRTADTNELHAAFSLSKAGETILLSNAEGRLLSKMSFSASESDICWSRSASGAYVTSIAPTPRNSNDAAGAANLEAQLRQQNPYQIVINEVMASTRIINEDAESSYDWVELYNASGSAIDLSGWGLSDTSSRPRKWQFPDGAMIASGQYMVVYLSGEDTAKNGAYHTSFSLSSSEGEAVVLSLPDGTIVDRTPITEHYADISLGRISGVNGFVLFETPTPGGKNSSAYYYGRASEVQFSHSGGLMDGAISLTLTAGEGETIFYTTDCTDPTTASTVYSGPISVSSTTVVRAVAVRRNYLDSIPAAHTYIFGADHTLPVISLISDPDGMFGDKNGMYTNYKELWARDAYIEYYTPEGEVLFSQGAEISLHGNDARLCDQKTMNVIARSTYGDNRFRAAIFPNRDYTEYQSFLLRPSSEDSNYSRMRCSILSSLLEGGEVLYQDTVVAVLYINGDYWGHYNLRERVNTHAIAQWEGWSNPDIIDLVKGNSSVKQGSNKSFKDLLAWLDDNSLKDEANLAYVDTIVDVENYLDYVMFQMYVANSDLLNVKRYRSTEGDNRWRWVVFDLDWAFYNDTNSWKDWLGEKGCGISDATDNTLFRALMENDDVKEYFLRRLGERLASDWSSSVITQMIDERAALIEPEMEATYALWEGTVKRWREKTETFRNYAITRPSKLIGYIAEYEDLSDAEIEEYFGDALRANPVPAN